MITMVIKASPDGTDNPSTSRLIEIVARDGGKPDAHRAHHSSISKATWTRCLEECFEDGNEISGSKGDSPILRQLMRTAFAEGSADDSAVQKAFVRQVHETFTLAREKQRVAAAADDGDESDEYLIESVTHVYANGDLSIKVEFQRSETLLLRPEVEGVGQHAELSAEGSEDLFLSLWYTPPLRSGDTEAPPEVSGDAALRAIVENLLPWPRTEMGGDDLAGMLEKGLAKAITQRIAKVKKDAGRRLARKAEVELAHHRKLYLKLAEAFSYEMNQVPHDMVRGCIPLVIHLVRTNASSFPAGLEERQELASHLLTAAGARNIDFIKIQAPRRIWNNSGKPSQSGQKRARGRPPQLTTTLALSVSPTPTEETLRALVELQAKAIRQETLAVKHRNAVYDVYVTLGEQARGEESCSMINIKPNANSSFEDSLAWVATHMQGPFLWRGARTARNISQALPLSAAYGAIMVLPLTSAGYDELAAAVMSQGAGYSITSTCGRTVAKDEGGKASWDTDLNRTGKLKKRGKVVLDVRLVNLRDMSSAYHKERVRSWVKISLDKPGDESKAEPSLVNHLHFTDYMIGRQKYHQIHLSNITPQDLAKLHGAVNLALHGPNALTDRGTFVAPNSQRQLAVEVRIGEWDKVYKGSQACSKCLQMGHGADDCVCVRICDVCYFKAPDGACANPDGCQRFGNGANGRRFEVMRKQQRQQAVIAAMSSTGSAFILTADRVVAQIDTNLPTAIGGRERPRTAVATKSSGAIAEQQLKKRCSRLVAANAQAEKELDAVIAALGLPEADSQTLTRRQRSKLIAYVTDMANPHVVRVAMATEYGMEQLVTGPCLPQPNMMLQNQMNFAMLARQARPQIQLTPGISDGMSGMRFHTPTGGSAQRAIMNTGRGTGFSFPSKQG